MYQAPKRQAGQGSNRAERLLQIIVCMLQSDALCGEGVLSPIGTYKIAKLIGMQPNNHLRGLLNELCREGYLKVTEGRARNGTHRQEWCLTRKWRQSEYKPRVMKIAAIESEANHAH